MSETAIHCNGVAGDGVITYSRKRSRKRGRTSPGGVPEEGGSPQRVLEDDESLRGDLRGEGSSRSGVEGEGSSMRSPKKELEELKDFALVKCTREVLVNSSMNKDTRQPSEHFHVSGEVPPDPNTSEKKREQVELNMPPSLQDNTISTATEYDAERLVAVVENASPLAIVEVPVTNLASKDMPRSFELLQSSGGMPTVPNAFEKKMKQVEPSMPPSLQEDADASFAPKNDFETSVAVIEDAGDSAFGEVSGKYSPKQKNKDIGWDHGVRVGGNSYRWQCNWCGVIRWGGVCRLKQHLAGAPQVRKCPNVPEHISEVMRKHLNPGVLKAIEAINSRSPADDVLDKAHKFSSSGISESKAFERLPKDNKRSRTSGKQSETIIQRPEIATVEAVEEPIEVQYVLDRAESHWRNALEHMLELPDATGGGGIQSCIRSVLRAGPSVCTTKSKPCDISVDATDQKDSYNVCYEVQDQSQKLESSAGAGSDASKSEPCGHADGSSSLKCQNVLSKIFSSESFVSLCDLMYGTFQGKKAIEMLDINVINTKMINGDYERSPELFDQDIGQVWEKIRKLGQEMMILANNLSNLSPASSQKQSGENLVGDVGEKVSEETCQVGVEQRISMESNTIQFPSESDRSTKPDVTEASCLYKTCTCKLCGTDADGKHSLICDGCEAMFHLSCIEPGQQRIPKQSWYCGACIMNRQKSSAPLINRGGTSDPITNTRETPQPGSTSIQPGLHSNCAVCDRLEVSETQREANEIDNMVIDSRESSVSSLESYELPEPSRTAISRLCKKCGTCEDDDRRFLVCAHIHCPYKFYHIRCLKYSQTVSLQKRNHSCWYCPSCLCRSCLSDKDDDQIVLCDSCDEGYHTYCMKPPLDSIPRGQWYCISCTAVRAKEGMRRYEQMVLQRHGKNTRQSNEVNRSMDILLCAVEKISSEDKVTVYGEER